MSSFKNKEPKSNLAKLVLQELAEQSVKKEGFVKSSWIKSTRPDQGSPNLFKESTASGQDKNNQLDEALPCVSVELGC